MDRKTCMEYMKWMEERHHNACEDGKQGGAIVDIYLGKAGAFRSCIEKFQELLELEEKLQGDNSDAVAAETAYVMRKIEELRKDMDSKTQSNNDKMDNLKKQLKESKERAENGWERVQYLERKLRDIESLNDQLLRELARRQCNERDMVSELLRLQPEEANGVE